MGVHRYRVWSGAMPTTAALVSISTGTAIKTILQLTAPATRQLVICGWGMTFDDPPGADAVFELVETDVAATVTAHVASGINKLLPGIPASLLTLGASATGYNGTVEGAITTVRVFDTLSVSSVSAEAAPLMSFYKNFEQTGIPPVVDISKNLRVRATTPTTAVDMRCFVDIEE